MQLSPNLKFAGTVNIDETTHGFADKVYDRAQLIELPLQRSYVVEYLEGEPYAEDRSWRSGTRCEAIAPFGFRVLQEIHLYVNAAMEIDTAVAGRAGRAVRAEGAAQGARCREFAGRRARRVPAVIGDEFPLARAKTETMREDYAAHGFASFF